MDIINTEILFNAYSNGYFPMADSNDGPIYLYTSDPRAIFPLESIKMPKSVRRSIAKNNFQFKIDTNFEDVIRKCAAREGTWISEEIINLYIDFHYEGYAHSVETYKDNVLVGGLYGVAIGGAFFGESMFTEVTDASKAAFYYLTSHIIDRGFILLDSQFINDHTASLGAIEIPKRVYNTILSKAILLPSRFSDKGYKASY